MPPIALRLFLLDCVNLGKGFLGDEDLVRLLRLCFVVTLDLFSGSFSNSEDCDESLDGNT